jgi:hypothetical protein
MISLRTHRQAPQPSLSAVGTGVLAQAWRIASTAQATRTSRLAPTPALVRALENTRPIAVGASGLTYRCAFAGSVGGIMPEVDT